MNRNQYRKGRPEPARTSVGPGYCPYRALACAVIAGAFRDMVRDRADATRDKEASDAEYFLKDPDNGALVFWCEVADLDPAAVVSYAQKAKREHRHRLRALMKKIEEKGAL